MGLFGSVNVEPKGAEWYRSQITEAELRLAQKKNADGTPHDDNRRPAGAQLRRRLSRRPAAPGRHADPEDARCQQQHRAHGSERDHHRTRPRQFPGRHVSSRIQSNPIAISRSANSPSSITTRSKRCRRFRSLKKAKTGATSNPLRSRCTVCATPSRSTTAPAASAPRFLPTVSASARWPNAPNVCLKSFSCRPGPLATRR